MITSLEAPLWTFHRFSNFRNGALRSISLGDNTCTTRAIYRQIAEAYYGGEAIAVEWRDRFAWGAEIERLAIELYEHASVFLNCRQEIGQATGDVCSPRTCDDARLFTKMHEKH